MKRTVDEKEFPLIGKRNEHESNGFILMINFKSETSVGSVHFRFINKSPKYILLYITLLNLVIGNVAERYERVLFGFMTDEYIFKIENCVETQITVGSKCSNVL